jgi:hypothetical protein
MVRLARLVLTLSAVALITSASLRAAEAAAPAPELMSRLAVHAASFERMKKHASYAVSGRLEKFDEAAPEKAPDEVKEMKARVVADGTNVRFEVVKYSEDGTDKTAEAQQKARERAAEAKKNGGDKKKEFRMPFFAGEQVRYTFDEVETDSNDPSRVRISFVPKARAEDTIEGSAWVDARTGTVVSAGFKMSKTPAFVDYVHITVEFGAPTALGPAVSRVKLDGRGGFLFFRKAFRVDARISDYAIVP